MSLTKPENKEELISWCFRRLGEPVTEVNVSPDQAEDCYEEALQFWREFNFDASIITYLKEQITPSRLNIQSGNANQFEKGDIITGDTSGATCIVFSIVGNNELEVRDVKGDFQANESFATSKTQLTGTIAGLNFIELGTYDKKYFDVNDRILSVTRVLPLSGKTSASYLFDVRYQFFINSMPTLTSLDLAYYASMQSYLGLLNEILVGTKPIRYSRHQNRIYLDADWGMMAIGDNIVFEVHQAIDEEFASIYNDKILKRYLTALIKKQWGNNLKKYNGVQLPGGVTMNGQQIYEEAVQELEQLKEEMKLTYQLPIDFYLY